MRLCLVLTISLIAILKAGAAEDFRVDTRLFFDNQKEPISQSTTIFQNNAVYDYLDHPAEVSVYDKDDGSFVLLNTTRRVYAEIRRQQVLQFTEQMRQRAAEQSDPFVKFQGSPSFTTEFDQETSVLTLSSPWMTYRVNTVQGPTPGSAERYREFTDWTARLAPMISTAARLPFARLQLNAALMEHGLVPREIQLTLTPKQGIFPKRISYRSEHQWINRLDTADLVRITQTRQFMTIFSPISLDQYIKSGQ